MPRRDIKTLAPARRTMTMKWMVVLAGLSAATVLDGLRISDLSRPLADAMAAGERASVAVASITLPSDRCGPGCAIMVAANLTGDAFSARAQ